MLKASDLQTKRGYVPRTLKDKLEALDPARRADVEVEADRLHADYVMQVQLTETNSSCRTSQAAGFM